MSLLDAVRDDVMAITTNSNEFAQDVRFTSPSPDSVTVVVKAIHSKHNLSIDTDGNAVQAKKASVAVSEPVLLGAGYVVRNANQEVSLNGHRVSVADVSAVVKEYVVLSAFADEMVGLVVCILGDWE